MLRQIQLMLVMIYFLIWTSFGDDFEISDDCKTALENSSISITVDLIDNLNDIDLADFENFSSSFDFDTFDSDMYTTYASKMPTIIDSWDQFEYQFHQYFPEISISLTNTSDGKHQLGEYGDISDTDYYGALYDRNIIEIDEDISSVMTSGEAYDLFSVTLDDVTGLSIVVTDATDAVVTDVFEIVNGVVRIQADEGDQIDFESTSTDIYTMIITDSVTEVSQMFEFYAADVDDTGVITLTNDDSDGSGGVTQGDTITATLSDDDGSSSVTYQWERDGNDIRGETSQTYTLAQDDVGATISVEVSYTDGFDSSSVSVTEDLSSVSNVNDAPVNTVGADVSVHEDTAVSITGSSVSDADSNDTSLTIQITADVGTFSLASTTGLTFTAGDGTSDTTMTFSGTVTNINTAIATITWTSDADDDSDATITIVSTDDDSASDTDTIAITVSSVNDAGSVTVSQTDSDSDSTFVGDVLTATLSGPDGTSGISYKGINLLILILGVIRK